MNMQPTPDPFESERAALGDIATCAREQLEALRTGESDRFQESADRTMVAVSALDRQQKSRRDRVKPVEASSDARHALEVAAGEARQACDDLEFALGHAVAIGRDLLTAWNSLATPAAAQVYTSGGRMAAADGSGHLNATG